MITSMVTMGSPMELGSGGWSYPSLAKVKVEAARAGNSRASLLVIVILLFIALDRNIWLGLVQRNSADVLQSFFIGLHHPDQYAQKEQTENDEGSERVDAYAGDLFEIVYELHGLLFLNSGVGLRLDVFTQSLQVSNEGDDLRVGSGFYLVGLQT